jgi:HAD superfamily hydrolase (TIGR01509 family)
MSARPLEAILFDLDGTLVDTELAAAQVIHEQFRSWGCPVDAEDARYLTGRTWAKAFELLFAKYPIPVPHDEAATTLLDAYRDALEANLPVVEGSADAVRSLAGHYPLALVSGSNRREILWALGKLGVLDRFKIVLGAEDYPRSKPAPDGYAKAIELLGVAPSATLVFEDSQPGIESALAAGTKVVAITGTNHFNQNTRLAHHHIPDLRTVDVGWIRQLWATLA